MGIPVDPSGFPLLCPNWKSRQNNGNSDELEGIPTKHNYNIHGRDGCTLRNRTTQYIYIPWAFPLICQEYRCFVRTTILRQSNGNPDESSGIPTKQINCYFFFVFFFDFFWLYTTPAKNVVGNTDLQENYNVLVTIKRKCEKLSMTFRRICRLWKPRQKQKKTSFFVLLFLRFFWTLENSRKMCCE